MIYIRWYTLIYNFYNDSERHMVILVTFLLIYQHNAPVNMCICFIIDTYRMSLTVSNIICKLGLTLDFLIFVVSTYLILFSYMGIFIYIEMDHLHFDNAGILYKTHVWKVHQTSNECKLYILASKSTECCFCISTLYSASQSIVKKKKTC